VSARPLLDRYAGLLSQHVALRSGIAELYERAERAEKRLVALSDGAERTLRSVFPSRYPRLPHPDEEAE